LMAGRQTRRSTRSDQAPTLKIGDRVLVETHRPGGSYRATIHEAHPTNWEVKYDDGFDRFRNVPAGNLALLTPEVEERMVRSEQAKAAKIEKAQAKRCEASAQIAAAEAFKQVKRELDNMSNDIDPPKRLKAKQSPARQARHQPTMAAMPVSAASERKTAPTSQSTLSATEQLSRLRQKLASVNRQQNTVDQTLSQPHESEEDTADEAEGSSPDLAPVSSAQHAVPRGKTIAQVAADIRRELNLDETRSMADVLVYCRQQLGVVLAGTVKENVQAVAVELGVHTGW
jgi:hypothetical protein